MKLFAKGGHQCWGRFTLVASTVTVTGLRATGPGSKSTDGGKKASIFVPS